MLGAKILQETGGIGLMEFRIVRGNFQKETVGGGAAEALHVENRMMRHGQSVQSQHTENSGKRRAKNGEFESHGNERGPTVQGTAGNIDGVSDDRDPIFETESGKAADNGANQSTHLHGHRAETDGFGESFDRHRSVRFHLAVAGFAGFLGRGEDLLGSFKLGEQAIKTGVYLSTHPCSPPCLCSSWCTSSRISAMAMAG